MKKYLLQLLIAIDQLFNAIFNGWADETLSSRAFRAHRDGKKNGWVMHPINWLFWWQEGHCQDAYESELLNKQLPPEFRE